MMWWVTPGTRAAGFAEAVFNALWLLLWLFPAAALIGGSGSEVDLAAAVLLLLGLLALRFGFDLSAARREREGDTLRGWMLIVRYAVAEKTVRAVIGWYLGLAGLGVLFVLGVDDRLLMTVAVVVYILSLLYVAMVVAWTTRVPVAGRAPTRSRAAAGAVGAVTIYIVISVVQLVSDVSTWRSSAIGLVVVAAGVAAWLKWVGKFSREHAHDDESSG